MTVSEHITTLLAVNRVVHEPARLVILSILYAVDSADFTYLANETGLTKGNLSSHLTRLEQTKYVTLEKTYKGKMPLTICRITADGGYAFEQYLRHMSGFLNHIET